MLGGVTAALATAVASLDASATTLLAIAACLAVLSGALDSGVLGFAPPFFKRQVNDMPISPRCVSSHGAGAAIQITPAQSAYSFYASCQPYQTANLSYVSNAISKPTNVNAGGNLGTVTTRYLTYKYACDSSYSSCGYMEVFALGKGVGLYDWKYYTNQSGNWVLNQESVINNFSVGHSTPYFACPNTAQ